MPRCRLFWKYVFLPLFVNAALLGYAVSRDANWLGAKPLAQRAGCLLNWRPNLMQGIEQRFPGPSEVVQRMVDRPSILRDEATDTPGWRQYAVAPGQTSQVLEFEVRTGREELLFLPRASGRDSGVEVAAIAAGKAERVFAMRGNDTAWTPISALYRIGLACQERDAPLTLRVTLFGPWAQLWHKDGQVFF